jgi:hypothetical protein
MDSKKEKTGLETPLIFPSVASTMRMISLATNLPRMQRLERRCGSSSFTRTKTVCLNLTRQGSVFVVCVFGWFAGGAGRNGRRIQGKNGEVMSYR